MNNTTNKQKLLLIYNEAKKHFPQLQREEEFHHIGELILYSSLNNGEFYQIKYRDTTVTSNGNTIRVEFVDRENLNVDFETWAENVLHELTNELAKKLVEEFSR
jgi:hypothetical protein